MGILFNNTAFKICDKIHQEIYKKFQQGIF